MYCYICGLKGKGSRPGVHRMCVSAAMTTNPGGEFDMPAEITVDFECPRPTMCPEDLLMGDTEIKVSILATWPPEGYQFIRPCT